MAKLEEILKGTAVNHNSGLSDTDITEVREYVKQNPLDIDYGSLFALHRTLFLGERHTVISDKQQVIDNIPATRKSGLTHLALEMLPASMQGTINQYFESGKKRDELFAYLQDHWGDKGEGVAEKYMEIIDTAKKLGVKVIALDIDSDEYQRKDISQTWVRRNKQWAKLIADELARDKDSKVLVYHGSGHAGYYPVDDRANNELRKLGYDSLTIKFCGGVRYVGKIGWDFKDKIEKSAQELGLQNKRFVVNIDRTTSREADLYIHLPQVENDALSQPSLPSKLV